MIEINEEDYEAIEERINTELNYKAKCFNYSFDEMPNDKMSDEKTIFITYGFNCYCYDESELRGHKAFFKIEQTQGRDYITYGDIFIQSDKQMIDYLNDWIKKEKWNGTNYQDLLCNHIYTEGIDKTTQIQYDLFCGS